MSNQEGSITIYLVIIAILVSALFWTNLDKLSFLRSNQKLPCKKNGLAPQKDLQTKYTVQDGDTDKLELFYGQFKGVERGLWTFDGGDVTSSIPQIQFDDISNKDDIKPDVCYAVITNLTRGFVLSVTPQ